MRHIKGMLVRAITLATVLTVSSGCGLSTLDPRETSAESIGEGRRALFIGNSYLYTQDIPAIAQGLADSSGGDKLAVAMIAGPNMALIDHWNAGAARAAIARGGWEWVILQQGPSSVELNRDTLRLAVQLFATEISKVNAKTVLFSAWPSAGRRQDFPRAIESYQLAATDVGGMFLPIAGAWMATWARDETLALYADGLHPSASGAYLSSLVVYSCLLGVSPDQAPASFSTRGGRLVSISPASAGVLRDAAVEVWRASCAQ